jgi:hopanoid biosynthesis associated protein HpnK
LRRLIVNADDFGFTSGVNRAIIEAHSRGIVTSSTLMANGPAFHEAVDLARSAPALSIGCHVVLIDGQPVLDAQKLPSLTASHRFRDGLKNFAARALTGRIDEQDVFAEAKAQIGKIQSAGIAVSHLDTHKHTHLFPRILRPLLRAARECGVRAIRNPFGPRLPMRSSQLMQRPNLWTRYAQMRVFGAFANNFRHVVAENGLATTTGTLGVEVTGALDETLFHAIAETIPDGTWEFVCHPGYNDADLQKAHTRLRESRETELRVLTLPAARAILEEKGIQLISYRDLVAGA